MTKYKYKQSNFKKLIEERKSEEASKFLIDNRSIADQLLSDYFKDFNIDEEFEIMLCVSEPKLLIHGIRLSQAFLKEKHRSRLFQLKFLDEDAQLHQAYWKKLYSEDESYWHKITGLKEKWETPKVTIVLSNLINWIETKRFENYGKQNLHQLASTYNFIISLYLSENYSKTDLLNEDELHEAFCETIHKPNTDLNQLFDTINNYVAFRDNCLNAYCYDLNVKPKITKGQIDICYYDEEKMADWRRDGERYHKSESRYLDASIKEYSSSGHIHSDRVYESNLYFDVQISSLEKLLSDIYLTKFFIKGKTFETITVFKPLIRDSFYKEMKYELPLSNLRMKLKSWQECFDVMCEFRREDNDIYKPYYFGFEQDYINLNLEANSPVQQKLYKEIVKQFSYTIKEEYTFDRHKTGYNVWHSPFVKLGEYLFCPMIFLTGNNWFYAVAQVAFENQNKRLVKESTEQMEKELLYLFNGIKKWNAYKPVEYNDKGDIDIVVEDADMQLLIQLKRTYFRLNLESAYFETTIQDRKAFSQLNVAEAHYKKHPKELKLKKNRFKWVVSTSFENINQINSQCNKINYLELIWILRFENKKFSTLQEFVNYMESDKILEL